MSTTVGFQKFPDVDEQRETREQVAQESTQAQNNSEVRADSVGKITERSQAQSVYLKGRLSDLEANVAGRCRHFRLNDVVEQVASALSALNGNVSLALPLCTDRGDVLPVLEPVVLEASDASMCGGLPSCAVTESVVELPGMATISDSGQLQA